MIDLENNKKYILFFLGLPGSGKGTVIDLILHNKKKYNFKIISTSKILKNYSVKTDSIANSINKYISNGNLVPDHITNNLMDKEIKNNFTKNLIIDGYPRSTSQMMQIIKTFIDIDRKIDPIIFLNIDENIVIKRLQDRKVCLSCNLTFNKLNLTPIDNKYYCLKCKKLLITRADDNVNIIIQRLKNYYKLTLPIINYLKQNNIKYIEINANNTTNNICNEIYSKLNI